MRILTIRHRGTEHEYCHMVANDDLAADQLRQLKRADKNDKFDFAVIIPDAFNDALSYVKAEQS
jgi:hypothetical protein